MKTTAEPRATSNLTTVRSHLVSAGSSDDVGSSRISTLCGRSTAHKISMSWRSRSDRAEILAPISSDVTPHLRAISDPRRMRSLRD